MTTVPLGPMRPEVEALIARRRALGQDTYDEVWEGVYHMAPEAHSWHGVLDEEITAVLRPRARAAGLQGSGPFNLGRHGDYRVPDRAYHRGVPDGVWIDTCAIVVEILSPDDETFEKFGFYARHGVDEVLVADPRERSVQWFRRDGDGYTEVGASELLAVTAAELSAELRWPGRAG